ncbi:MAG: M23 family metallopeptidase [Lachnospiraceae bacterium]|nr:M23 family metallopeptidase [Lachnospiraceae bacterium]
MGRKQLFGRQMIMIILILVEILLIWLLIHREKPVTAVDWLGAYATETDEFRAMDFGAGVLEEVHRLAKEWDEDVYSILAAQMIYEASSAEKSDKERLLSYRDYKKLTEQLREEKPVEWTKLVNGFRTILADIRYFPVAADMENGLSGLGYENGWGDARTYGGDRRHEGTDIMDNANVRGSYPIVSISDGVIEHIGWLEQGGYRIGIRSPHGAYFYYAHLSHYAEDFVVGQPIAAGQIIGFMGDTGYSAVEGTVGNFPVHLHMGIYLETDHYDELSVNPYYILKYLENCTVSYAKETHLWYSFSERSRDRRWRYNYGGNYWYPMSLLFRN